jgi:hypothetical protein
MKHNVQNYDRYINVRSSQTYRSYWHFKVRIEPHQYWLDSLPRFTAAMTHNVQKATRFHARYWDLCTSAVNYSSIRTATELDRPYCETRGCCALHESEHANVIIVSHSRYYHETKVIAYCFQHAIAMKLLPINQERHSFTTTAQWISACISRWNLKIEPCDTELAINLSGNETGGSYAQLRGQCSKQSLK